MANRIKGITIEIDGNTTGLDKALQSINKSIRESQTALKDVDRLLKLNPSSTELLSQKQQYLGEAVAATRSKLIDEMEAMDNLNEKAKKGEDVSAQQNALKREIEETTQSLKNLTKEYEDFGSVGAQQVAVVGEKFKEAGDKISGVGKGMTATVTAPLVGLFTVAAAGASDLEENLNKVDVAFGNDAQAVKDWADSATAQFGLSKNAALEAASLFGDMGTAMGLTTEDAAKMSTNLAGLAGDLSSFKNIDVEQAMNALKGVFTGETESLKGLGVIMNQTNLKQFAEDCGLVYEEMSQAELVNLRYNYVLEQTKNAAGDYARTSDGTANSIRTLQATLSNLTAELGSALLPIITPVIQKITEFARSFAGLDEGTKNTIVTIGLVIAALGPLLTVIGTVISTIGTIMTMAPALSGAIAALSGPIGIAVVAVGAAIAAGVALYQNWDTVKSKASELWSSIKSTFENIKNSITEKINAAKDAVMGAVEKIKGAFNFQWKLPSLKLPHFSITEGKLGLPSISVSWYKKGYTDGVLFNSPTVLPTANGWKGFGDGNGGELVIGLDRLREVLGTTGNSVNVNVYASPGMNETALANKVAAELDHWLGKRL